MIVYYTTRRNNLLQAKCSKWLGRVFKDLLFLVFCKLLLWNRWDYRKNSFEKLNFAPTKLRFAKWIQSFIIFFKKREGKRNETHVRLTKYYSTNIIIIKAIFVTLKKFGYSQQQAGKNLLNWFSSIWLQSL